MALTAYDLDGNDRIAGLHVDMGAYEWAAIPRIACSLSSVMKKDVELSILPEPMDFKIWNSGSSTLKYSIQENIDWLDISSTNGQSSGYAKTFTLQFNTDTMPIGIYTGTITIQSLEASNDSLILEIILEVYIPVLDRFEWEGVPDLQIEDSPFLVSLYAMDQNDHILPSFTEQVSLSVFHSGWNYGISPTQTEPFTAGTWKGFVTVMDDANDRPLRAISTDGTLGDSNEITVYSPYEVGADGIPYDWEKYYYGNTSTCIDSEDDDEDGYTNFEEYVAGTNPIDPESYLLPSANGSSNGVVLRWNAVSGRVYGITRCPNLMHESFENVITTLSYPQNSYTDTVHRTENTGYYRVNVKLAE